MGDLRITGPVLQSGGNLHSRILEQVRGGIVDSWVVVSCWGSCRSRSWSVSRATDGRNWSGVSGMTMASNRLVYATTGALSTVDFSGGLPTCTAAVVSGPPSTARPGSPGACSSSNPPT
jgi:hypothetical protein